MSDHKASIKKIEASIETFDKKIKENQMNAAAAADGGGSGDGKISGA